ncbi:MAG TPA: metallophosphoesterase [Chitinophagaceae bacterium]|nr:metallophosphoesterase [Chitinophagaceae bacterium]
MRNSPFWWVFIGFMVLLDIYIFQAVRFLSQNLPGKTKTFIYSGYWIISVAAIIILIVLPFLHFEKQARITRATIFSMIAGFFFAKLIAAVFFLFDDVRRGIQWAVSKLFQQGTGAEAAAAGDKISRSAFLSWAGMIAGGGLFGTLVYGFRNKYRYQVKRHKLAFSNLPKSFKGVKLVHISDIHSGSFTDKEAVMKGVYKVMQEKPDLILFTGDLVNNVADEMKDYMDVFNKLEAPLGVYSTLGNHDYGDYTSWDSEEEKAANLDKLKSIHGELGWRLMMNEHVSIEKNGEKIALLGIENWSAKARFPKYGDLEKAHYGTDDHSFKILLSHDPSHWKAEVCSDYQDIDLMLAGHTHGMQFGVEIPGFRWSPVQYVYNEWAGLYEKRPADKAGKKQYLYVNRGFGFIGYPGRVGILPEITVIELA